METTTAKQYYREYWSRGKLYRPIFAYWLWNSVKLGSMMYVYDANPGMPPVGFLTFSKWQILQQLDPTYLPPTLVNYKQEEMSQEILEGFAEQFAGCPLIIKPDAGERGRDVYLAHTTEQAITYLQQHGDEDLLIQEYIPYELELGIMRYRYPHEEKGHITSITIKEFPEVRGDGIHTLRQLVQQHERCSHYEELFASLHPHIFDKIVSADKKIRLNNIGNHSKGTKFVNGNYLINNQLVEVMDNIAADIDGFYYGRFDLRVSSIEDLYQGKQIKILEVNGIQSEPGHIYDPHTSLRQGYQELFKHRKIMYHISKINRKQLKQNIDISLREHIEDELKQQKEIRRYTPLARMIKKIASYSYRLGF